MPRLRRSYAAADLVETLYRGLADNSVGRVIDTVLRVDLVILDELGFAPLDATGSQLFFRFIAHLLIGVGQAAVQAGLRVRYFTAIARVRTRQIRDDTCLLCSSSQECRCGEHCVRRWAVASRRVLGVILPKDRDRRFVTIRRGGTLTESDHQLLALWAASCAEHVLGLFESAQPEDQRPRQAIDEARAWVRREITMSQARTAAGHANAAARDLRGAARHAAYAAGQAAAVVHVAAHELGAAAYAIKAARAAAPEGEGESAGRLECRWQRDQLAEAIRELVLDDQRLRNDICWSVFDC